MELARSMEIKVIEVRATRSAVACGFPADEEGGKYRPFDGTGVQLGVPVRARYFHARRWIGGGAWSGL
jgi:hypothetical protein